MRRAGGARTIEVWEATATRASRARGWRLGAVLLAACLAAAQASPARAWITLAEGEKGKLEVETRLMFWGVSAGPDDVPSGTPAQQENVQDFFLRRARIALRAQPSPKLELYTQFGQDNIGSKISVDETGFRIKDMYLNYKIVDGFQVTVGQFKVPFLRQNLESSHNQLLVDRAVLPGLRPAREGTRDTGAMMWGNLGGFQYRTAVFDGSDQEDSNSHSSFRGSARTSYNWFTHEPGAGLTGATLGQKRVLQIGAQTDAQNQRVDGKDDAGFTAELRDYRAYAADVFYDEPFNGTWALTVEGAWLDRRDNYENPALATRSIRGYYAQAGFLLPGHVGHGRLQIAGRYEDLNMERGSAETSVTNRGGAISFLGKGHDRKIQLDHTRRREEPTDLDNDEVRLSVIAVF